MMPRPAHVTEVFLQPCEFYFGNENTRIRTLLGSCVSITMWHPILHIGGMCHYMLPLPRQMHEANVPDGRYAEGAMQLFLRDIERSKTLPSQYQLKIFGGGQMFLKTAESGDKNATPNNNIEAARALVNQYGFKITAEHLGGAGYREIIFELWNGHVWVKHVDAALDHGRRAKKTDGRR